MTTTQAWARQAEQAEHADQAAALAERLFRAGLESFELLTVYLGLRLGLYSTLARGGPATPAELAASAGVDERYAREWLEQQAVAGILTADDVTAAPEDRRYRLPSGHAEALLDEESLSHAGPFALFLMCAAPVVPELLGAYRTGAGVPYARYGRDHVEGQGAFNRASFSRLLATEWLPVGAPDVHARLQATPSARVLDVACGVGWSSIALARGYPLARVEGVDSDAPSMEEARRHAAEAGMAERVRFILDDAAGASVGTDYDVVFIFEALHDMSRPVEVLAGIRTRLAAGGAVIVMDERAAETFTAPGDETERFLYSASVLCCLPVGRSEQPSAATGTVLRPETVRRYATEAGFASIEVLPVEHAFFRFYRLVP